MSIAIWVLPLSTAIAAAAMTWWATHWWHSRQHAALNERLDRVRQTAAQNAQQTRRQIAQLQEELAKRPVARRREPDPQVEAAARKAALDETLDAGDAAMRDANGFAATQPMLHH
jgi:hypothetical protein